MIRMTIHNRTLMALSYLSKTLWLIGARTAEWEDEYNPPLPTGAEVALGDVQFAKTFQEVKVVYEGTQQDHDLVVNANTYWKIASTEEIAYTNSARHLYLKAVVGRGEGPDVEVRQFGISTDLVPTAGNEGLSLLLYNEIDDAGKLLFLDNKTVVNRNPLYQGEAFEYILGF